MSDPEPPELEWVALSGPHDAPAEAAAAPSLPLYAPPPPGGPRRSLTSIFGVVVGVMALLAATTFAVTALDQSDGASSPEAAVHDLFDAIAHRDALGVIESLPANERDVLRDPVVDMASQLKRLGILSSSFKLDAIPGAELSVHDLALSTTPIGKDVVAVKIVGGTISGRSIPADLPIGPTLHRILHDDLGSTTPTSSSSFSANLADGDVKLVTVKDGGGWHVSLGYTIAEAIRGDGPAPDFAAAPVPVGSDSPDGAVRDLVAAAEARDLRKVVSLMAPDEDKALYAYASLFVGKPVSSDSDPSVEISKLELSVTGSGSTRLVRIEAFAVKLVTSDTTMTMDFDGKCSTVQTTYADGYFSTPDLEPSFMSKAEQQQFQAEQAQQQAQLEQPHRTCAGEAPADGGAADIGTLGALGTSVQDFAITVVQIDGRWYLSPVRTLLDTVDRALQKLTPADLDKYGKWFGDETSGSSSSEFVPVAPAIGSGTGSASCPCTAGGTGTVVRLANGAVLNPDGTITKADGTVVKPGDPGYDQLLVPDFGSGANGAIPATSIVVPPPSTSTSTSTVSG